MWCFQHFLLFLCYSFGFAAIPNYINVCHRNDPKLGQCIINSIETLMPKLKIGIPNLNLPPIDPLPLDHIRLRSGPNQARIDADFSNLRVWGPSSVIVTQLLPNLSKKQFLAKIDFPHLYFEGNYDMTVNVLFIKYKGKGVIAGNFTNYKVDATLKYQLIQNGSKDFIDFTNMKILIKPGQSVLRLNRLENGNTAIANGMRTVLDDNTDVILKEILPTLEEGLSVKFREIGNNIAHTFPYDELLPE